MTNDLLPDEIYVRRTTKKGLSAVRPESPLADRIVPNQDSKLNRTKYIRADLVSTPNKPAEVDLDNRHAAWNAWSWIRSLNLVKFDATGFNHGLSIKVYRRQVDIIDNYLRYGDDYAPEPVAYASVEWLDKYADWYNKRKPSACSSGHLATGKGGGEPITGFYTHKYNMSEWFTDKEQKAYAWFQELQQRGHWYGHWPATVAQILKDAANKTEQQKTAAPTQSDAGELEAAFPDTCDGKEQDAFEAWAASEKMDMSLHPLHYLFLNPKTAAARDGWRAGIKYCRAHLAKSKGGV